MDRLTELLGYWNNSLPEKVDYADLVCAPAFARGYRMVYEDEYGYMVEDTIEALEELQQYRRAEQNGLLLRLPCNVGDSVYFIKAYFSCCKEPMEEKVDRIIIANLVTFKTENRTFCLNDIGTKVFLTKSEAEQALERNVAYWQKG